METASTFGEQHYPHLVVSDLQARAREWQGRFNSPLGLGVKKKLAIITCMDSRVHPERIFGLGIGEAEVIRNAGGRITGDVLRSWAVCQDLLACDTILVVHHTDCGGQEAARRRKELSAKLWDRLCGSPSVPYLLRLPLRGLWTLRGLLPSVVRGWAFDAVAKPITDLEASVKADTQALRRSPLMDQGARIYGFLYRVEDGALELVVKDEGAQGKEQGAEREGEQEEETKEAGVGGGSGM